MSGFLNHTPKQQATSKPPRSGGSTPKKWNIFRSSSSSKNRIPPPPPSFSHPSIVQASSPSLPIHTERHIATSFLSSGALASNDFISSDTYQLYSSPRSIGTNGAAPYPRTTSLPKSTTSTSTTHSFTTPKTNNLNHNNGMGRAEQPPKVKPFYQSSSSSSSSPGNTHYKGISCINSNITSDPSLRKRSLINRCCCFCEELLSTTIGVEKVIHLKCGDVVHEECLFLLLNDAAGGSNGLSMLGKQDKIFPVCQSCGKLAIPQDEVLLNEITSRFLTRSPTDPYEQQQPQQQQLQYQLSPPPQVSIPPSNMIDNYGNSKPTVTNQYSHSQTEWDKYQSLSLSGTKNSKDLSITIPGSNVSKPYRDSFPPPETSTNDAAELPGSLLNNQSNSHLFSQTNNNNSNNFSKAKSRGSSVSAISSIISSVPKTPSPSISSFSNNFSSNNGMESSGRPTSNDIDVTLYKNENISTIRQRFIAHLLWALRFSEITQSMIATKFGELRLVDKLQISTSDDNTQFSTFIVYLFQNNMVMLSSDRKKFKNVVIPKKIIKIMTLNQSTVKVSIPAEKEEGEDEDHNNTGQVIYIQNNKSGILSKWITAFCDADIEFDKMNLSTTIRAEDPLFGHSFNGCGNVDLNVIAETSFEDLERTDASSAISAATEHKLPMLLSPIDMIKPPVMKTIDPTVTQHQIRQKNITFQKTNQLTVCLNLKQSLIQNKKTLNTATNILKVLQMKYKSLFIVYAIGGKVCSFGKSVESVFCDISKGKSVQEDEDFNSILKSSDSEDNTLLYITDLNTKPNRKPLGYLKSQLHVVVNESIYALTQTDISSDTTESEFTIEIVTLTSWDTIMESITNKLNLSFEFGSENEYEDSDVEFDSDAYERDADRDLSDDEDEDQEYDVKDEISSLSSMEDFRGSNTEKEDEDEIYDQRDEISSLSDRSDDEDEDQEYDVKDEISSLSSMEDFRGSNTEKEDEDEIYDQRDEISSLSDRSDDDLDDESYDMRDDISSLSGLGSDISEAANSSSIYDRTTDSHTHVENSRWSSLFKDIDTALSDATNLDLETQIRDTLEQ